jgi:2-polyprenyl-3-methyl-5-hydroxy-6-metoxy-1,4-benzoquinol methylase
MNTPRRILYYLSYYKFASKMIGNGKRVLDIGCGEGLGTWLLANECGFAKGIDVDADAIKVATENWVGPAAAFECADFLGSDTGTWDAVVSFDVIEHILPENSGNFFLKAAGCLSRDGVLIFGTPNITSDRYASQVSKAGHVNLYSGERLEEEMGRHFHHVFMFGANDEVVHTGFLPMAHYLIAMGCGKRGRAK